MAEQNGSQNADAACSQTRLSRWSVAVAVGLLVLLVVAVFYPVFGFEFVDFDTFDQVVDNPYIRGLTYENVKHIFTSRCITSYYPVRTLTYVLNHEICGLNAGGFKLANVLIHLANALLVFWLVLRLVRDPAAGELRLDRRREVGLATLAGTVFSIHPVVVEPVVWIPGREELLMTLGVLGAVHFHISACRFGDAGARRQTVWACHLGVILCCAWACLSNAIGAIIPALIVTWDLLMLHRRKWTRMALGTAPLWVIAFATFITKKYGEPEETVDLIEMTLSGRALIGLNAYWLDLKTLVWPDHLCLYYDWLHPQGLFDVDVLLGIAAVLGSLVALWIFRRNRLVLFGILWFGLTLAPTLQIVMHHIHRADRFFYLPLVGVVVAMALALRILFGRIHGRLGSGLMAAVLIGVVIALAVRCSVQVPLWRTSLGVWQHCFTLDPDNARVHDVLGDHYVRFGQSKQAMAHYEAVLRTRPLAIETLENFGYCLSSWEPELRDYDRAVALVTRARDATEGKQASVRETLADVHLNYAHHLQQTGEYARAIQEYENALAADSEYAQAAFNLALLLATCPDEKLRRPEEAVPLAEWAQGRDRAPTVNTQLILATVYAQSGRFEAAIIATTRALDLAEAMGDAQLASDLERQIKQYQDYARQKRLP